MSFQLKNVHGSGKILSINIEEEKKRIKQIQSGLPIPSYFLHFHSQFLFAQNSTDPLTQKTKNKTALNFEKLITPLISGTSSPNYTLVTGRSSTFILIRGILSQPCQRIKKKKRQPCHVVTRRKRFHLH